MVEVSLERDRWRSEDRAVVTLLCGSFSRKPPAKIGDAEADSFLDGWELVVIKNDDAPATHETPEVDEVEENAVEAVIPVDERKIERSARRQESRQRDLRSLRVELQHPGGTCLIDDLRSEERRVGKECRSRWSPYH